MRAVLGAVLVWALTSFVAFGQELSALARLDPAASSLRDDGSGVALSLTISQPVPWRVRVLDAPPRLVMDFREVDWRGAADIPQDSARVIGARSGAVRPGWSRLVLELDGPYAVTTAGMATPCRNRTHGRCRPPPICHRRARAGRGRWWWCWTPATAALIRGPSATGRPRPP
jgi:N-acetylmuramoyl-L-alanine amidase